MLLFLTTNMVAVTGVTYKLAILDLYLITAPQGRVFQSKFHLDVIAKFLSNSKQVRLLVVIFGIGFQIIHEEKVVEF